VRPATLETTGLGAATLAWIGVGLWSGPEAVAAAWTRDRAFVPSRPDEDVA
jgi:glycerol kinase